MTTFLLMLVAGVAGAAAHWLYSSRGRSAQTRRELDHGRRLVEISKKLSGVAELSDTEKAVADLACRLLDAHFAAVLMLIEGGQMIEVKSAVGFASAVTGMRFPTDGSFSATVMTDGKPRASNDLRTEPYVVPDQWPQDGTTHIAVAPMLARGDTIGAISCVCSRPISESDLELLGALAEQAALAIENSQLFGQVNSLSMTDPLTGLANRRQLERDIGREFAAARRGRRLVAIMFDVNGFKAYNDRFGHMAGDNALRAFGRVLQTFTRAMNLASRYGGDEFFVLLADADIIGAKIFIQRVREHFTEEVAAFGHGPLTASAGIAEYSPEMVNPAQLIAAADRALYESKADRANPYAPADRT
jgi:diguanylate cyclase (GGDEF)-like protein